MPWEDLEHLVRQLFEWEFGQNGVEVKVTRASGDRGVDAIMFDPDPLRGGKYVLQAKRYTRTVDVAAVRDLYGTVANGGANRGILVTTSSYGSDSYDFAKDKPLSLVDGPHLIAMLKRHGRRYRIDLVEARRILSPDERMSPSVECRTFVLVRTDQAIEKKSWHGRGRDEDFSSPPAQIPACAANAPGSSLGFWRRSGDKAAGVWF
jgi:Restriction endonuclease